MRRTTRWICGLAAGVALTVVGLHQKILSSRLAMAI